MTVVLLAQSSEERYVSQHVFHRYVLYHPTQNNTLFKKSQTHTARNG